jgi:hypothetical protein
MEMAITAWLGIDIAKQKFDVALNWNRGAPRIAADFYGKTGPFGLISAGFGRFWLRLAGYGVLTWRAS